MKLALGTLFWRFEARSMPQPASSFLFNFFFKIWIIKIIGNIHESDGSYIFFKDMNHLTHECYQ